MKLLVRRDADRQRARTVHYAVVRARLRAALQEIAPGCEFWVFGSVTRCGAFNAASDVDVAYSRLPPNVSPFQLAAELEECIGCSVDLIDLAHSRLRPKILREGERWIT